MHNRASRASDCSRLAVIQLGSLMLEYTTEIIHYKELVSAWGVRELKARWLAPWRYRTAMLRTASLDFSMLDLIICGISTVPENMAP